MNFTLTTDYYWYLQFTDMIFVEILIYLRKKVHHWKSFGFLIEYFTQEW
jgi:hypothetical protein